MPALEAWAASQGLATSNPAKLLQEARVRSLIRAELDRYSRDFKGYEQVRDFVLDSELFTTQNDLLTPSLKLKRRNVLAKYADRLAALYRDAPARAQA